MMQALDKDLRGALEKTVKAARTVAEAAAHAAVDQLGVGHDKPEAYLSDAEKALRNRLRTHGKQLGDARDSKSTNPTYGKQEVQHLVQEVAYQHWHRMLFARFLADNNLLMYDGVAVTIEECDELAPDEGAKSGWELAGKLAARMLPQVFKPGSPVFELTCAPEHQSELERLLKDLPDAVFKASDSLGWVYQFWQADNKDRINKSEVKIGADELPAVTQLFTEPYMVAFLLHNSLGAWWATRHPGKPCPVKLDYFRTLEDGTPAAGKFEGWPDSLADFKLLDPCCGSGHFLVAAFLMLVPMRMAAESLTAKEAVNRVLAENIHGLELDPRCVEIAVFAVALEAWRYPDASGKPLGVREIPAPNIACCGLMVTAKAQDWEALVPADAPKSANLRLGLSRLHQTFAQAPILGSLLDPSRLNKGDLFAADYKVLSDLLRAALASERRASLADEQNESWELAIRAQGLLEAAHLLDAHYHLVITNVPYLGREGHADELIAYAERVAPDAAADLATLMLDRCLRLADATGSAAIVLPQNWWVGKSYEQFRQRNLATTCWRLAVVLGEEAWQSFGNRGPNTILLILDNSKAPEQHRFVGLDLGSRPGEPVFTLENKVASLAGNCSDATFSRDLQQVNQQALSAGRGSKISFAAQSTMPPLANFVVSGEGSSTGDGDRFSAFFWELANFDGWLPYIEPGPATELFADSRKMLRWEHGQGELSRSPQARIQNTDFWTKTGILVGRVRGISAGLFTGGAYTKGAVFVCAKREEDQLPVLAFLRSPEYERMVRERDPRVSASTSVLTDIPFDRVRWAKEAKSSFPGGAPKVTCHDPSQLTFHGHPRPSSAPLLVAVSRLVGYSWPAESDSKIQLSEEARDWVSRSRGLASHADKDGIVCLPPVGRESSASDRLLNLLAAAYGDAWSNDSLAQLLGAADHAGKSLESWLRDKFFAQHCALFGNRPFVWHVWDGLRDGFAALVNYHRLDYKTLEALIYTYLGDWIGRQKRHAENGIDGAQEKVAAAEALKKRLEWILAGESPYDIFVRWKPIEDQPIGWNPDLNDGVRLNIRPFLSVPDVGKRGAGVLRDRPNVKWDKDRGSDVPSAPWFELGLKYGGKVGDRINDHHLTLDEKRAARAKHGKA